MLRSEERWKEGEMPLSLLSFTGPPRKRLRSVNTGGGTMTTFKIFHFKHKVRETSISMQTTLQYYRKENTLWRCVA